METQLRDVLQTILRQSGSDTAGGHKQTCRQVKKRNKLWLLFIIYDRSQCDALLFFRKVIIIMCSSSDDDFMGDKFMPKKVKMLPLASEEWFQLWYFPLFSHIQWLIHMYLSLKGGKMLWLFPPPEVHNFLLHPSQGQRVEYGSSSLRGEGKNT